MGRATFVLTPDLVPTLDKQSSLSPVRDPKPNLPTTMVLTFLPVSKGLHRDRVDVLPTDCRRSYVSVRDLRVVPGPDTLGQTSGV